MLDPESVGQWAGLLNEYGFLAVFAIASGITNAFFVIQLLRGKLVTFSMYKKAIDEADRLQKSMEKDHAQYMSKLLEFMSGLKPHKEEKKNGNSRRSQ
ncbi:hypothetical protein D3C71_2024470 [compost metagenome]